LPAIQATRTELTTALKAGASHGHSRSSHAQSILVAAQAALSVLLLVGAGLFVRSLSNIRHLDVGYDTPRIVYGGVEFDTRDSVRDARRPQMLREVADRMRLTRGVEKVALARTTPTRGFSMLDFNPDVDTATYPKPFATY